jgi:hypothetical protein
MNVLFKTQVKALGLKKEIYFGTILGIITTKIDSLSLKVLTITFSTIRRRMTRICCLSTSDESCATSGKLSQPHHSKPIFSVIIIYSINHYFIAFLSCFILFLIIKSIF